MENYNAPKTAGGVGFFADIVDRFFNTRSKKIAFLVFLIIAVFFAWTLVSKTSGEVATLSLVPSTATITAGADFDVNINLDTKGNNVVEVKAMITYDPSELALQNINTWDSIFSTDNNCTYANRFCEIISPDPANGKVMIVAAKPTPGVNSSNGLVGKLTFRALKALTPSDANIKLSFVAYGDYSDSDVILDSKTDPGTDILNVVNHAKIAAVLPVPTGLVAASPTATEIILSWTNAIGTNGVTGYKIYKNSTLLSTVATNTYRISGLTPLTNYSGYMISAVDAGGHESEKTTPVSATTRPDTTSPTVPANITSSKTMTEITLNWQASSDDVGVSGYKIYLDGLPAGTTDQTNYTSRGLTANTTYKLQVAAFDAAGNESAKSSELSIKTEADTQAPTVPIVHANPVSISQIDLDWSASTDNVSVTGYNVYRNGAKVGTTQDTKYQDKNLAIETTYAYAVSAYDAAGNESAKSQSVSATTLADTEPPTVPTGLMTATPISQSEIQLAWGASTDNVGVVGYKIYRDGNQVATSPGLTAEDNGLTPGTTYVYEFSAYDAKGNESSKTPPITATTHLPGGTVNVLDPNGGETLTAGQTYTVRWTSTGISKVKLYIYDDRHIGSAAINYITPNNEAIDASLGRFDWQIVASLLPEPPPGLNYDHFKIRIDGLDDSGNELMNDFSDGYFSINISQPNTPPSISSIPDQSIQEGVRLIFNVVATDYDGDRVTLSDTGLPTGATFQDNGDNTGTFDWTPGFNESAVHQVSFVADDGKGGTDRKTVNISVTTGPDVQPPTTPENLAAEIITADQITLRWSPSSDNVAVKQYLIEYCTGQSCRNEVTPQTIYSLNNLSSGTTYAIKVSAEDTSQNRSAPATITATTNRKYGLNDFANLVTDWLKSDPNQSSPANVNGDDFVNTRDLGIMMSNWQ